MEVYDLIINITQRSVCFMRCSFTLWSLTLSAKRQAEIWQVGPCISFMFYLGVGKMKTLFKFLKYLHLKKITVKETFFYVQ